MAELLGGSTVGGYPIESVKGSREKVNALLVSPALTGTPTAPTATAGTNTTQLATTEFVITAVANKTSITGNAATATNADMLDGYHLSGLSGNGQSWGFVPLVNTDGVMEVGRYIDFHASSNDAIDNSFRLTGGSGVLTASGEITATQFNGNLNGNAGSATKLATARTIALGGDLSGSVSFDGTADITISASVGDDSHNHSISTVNGLQGALDGKVSVSGGMMSGTLSVTSSSTGNYDEGIRINNASDNWATLVLGGPANSVNGTGVGVWLLGRNPAGNLIFSENGSGDNLGLTLNTASGMTWKSNTVWHGGNDGSGSGLDADLLDGLDSSQFLRSDTDASSSGKLMIHRNGSYGTSATISLAIGDSDTGFNWTGDGTFNIMTDGQITAQVQKAAGIDFKLQPTVNGNAMYQALTTQLGPGSNWDSFESAGTYKVQSFSTSDNGAPQSNYAYGFLMVDRGSNDPENRVLQTYVPHTTDKNIYMRMRNSGSWFPWKTIPVTTEGRVVWHSENDGSGSGLDADMVDGYHTGGSGVVNSVVVRNVNGYIMNTWFNSDRAAENTAAAQYLYDTGDGYMRKKDLANVRAEIGGGNISDVNLDMGISKLMRWKNYGNSHAIFDASAGTAPDGTVKNNANPDNNWSSTYPTLMGWNGTNTYGVRVDTSRYSESAGGADTVDGKHAAATPVTVEQNDIIGMINETFTYASNGKSSIATAITGKGVSASGSDTFSTLSTKIGQIETSIIGIARSNGLLEDVMPIETLNIPDAISVYAVGVDSDGNIYMSCSGNYVKKFSPTGSLIWTYACDPRKIDIDAYGNVVIAGKDNTVKKINSSGGLLWSLGGYPYQVMGITVAKNGDIFSGDANYNVKKISSAGSLIWTSSHTGSVYDVATDDQGNVYSASSDNTARKWNANGVQQWSYNVGGQGFQIDVNNHGEVCVASAYNDIKKLNGLSGALIWSFIPLSNTYDFDGGCRFDKYGNVYGGCDNNNVYKVSPTGSMIWEYSFSDPSYLVLDEQCNVYVAGYASNKITKLSQFSAINEQAIKPTSQTLSQATFYSGHTSYANDTAVDNLGFIYTASSDYTVRKLTNTGALVWSYTGHTNEVHSVDVDDYGNVYTASSDFSVRKLNKNGGLVWSYTGHTNTPYAAKVDTSGNVFSGGADQTLRKINPSGGLVWSVNPTSSTINDIDVDRSGNVYPVSATNTGALKKYNTDGGLLWTGPGGGTYGMYTVTVDKNSGDVYTAGGDGWLRKTGAISNSAIWTYALSGYLCRGTTVDSQGNVYAGFYNFVTADPKPVKKFNSGGTFICEMNTGQSTKKLYCDNFFNVYKNVESSTVIQKITQTYNNSNKIAIYSTNGGTLSKMTNGNVSTISSGSKLSSATTADLYEAGSIMVIG